MTTVKTEAAFDPERLRSAAERLRRRAPIAPVFYAIIGLFLGVVLGSTLVVGTNVVRRVRQLRSQEDASEFVHSLKGDPDESTVEEVSLRDRVPAGAFGTGLFFAAVGAALGSRRAARMRFDAENALCLLEIEKNTRR